MVVEGDGVTATHPAPFLYGPVLCHITKFHGFSLKSWDLDLAEIFVGVVFYWLWKIFFTSTTMEADFTKYI